ncbi:UNVERIFIED_CONTAM: Phospholipase D zeta 1 [Sesamum angustifolium]|uniref:Phospholipase n=1 Tax=Sesamum angustifolium TaxID=2727405 RepID=A0AAW2NZ16_9LAMI
MSTERLISGGDQSAVSSSHSLRCFGEAAAARIFEELPTATIVSVSRPDASDITPLLLSYTIELQYKQFKWHLLKKASQVIYLHLALKKRAIIEEIHEKQEQVKEWLHYIGFGDHAAVVHDEDEPDDGAVPIYHDDTVKSRYVPSRAALPIIRPAIGKQQHISDKAKAAMQGYLNHFLGNLDIINSREVCKFLEVSRLSFSKEYGPKMKEGYVMVKHLGRFSEDNTYSGCCLCHCSGCCGNNWRKVWLILKPGFLAFLDNHFDTKLLDIIVFDVLPASNAKGDDEVHLAKVLKERNPLRHAFEVSCGNRNIKLRTTSHAKVQDWVYAINAVGSKRSESWCHPHRFNSFAPIRGLIEDGSLAQWFIDGKAAFEAIALSIESAKSEIYMTGWWLCPELYLRRPFHNHSSSRLDALLEAKAKEGFCGILIILSTGIYLWSHHEKLVIVDHKICFIGGLDLCFGRYDTTEHRVGDFPPFLWPGKDYYNPRESEPNSWEDTLKDELDREKYPRMPWHDVHCAVWGPPCRDIARHFVQRWNHAKRSKAPNEQTIPLLMPQHHMVLPHYMGRSSSIDIEKKTSEVNTEEIGRKGFFSPQTPPEDIPLLLPHEADGPDSTIMENKSNGLNSNDHFPAELSGHFTGSSFSYQDSGCPTSGDTRSGFSGDDYSSDPQSAMLTGAVSESDLQVKDYWWETQEQTFEVMSTNGVTQVGPRSSCHCQVVRSVSQWSAGTSQTEDSIHRAYCALIEEAEHFIYVENQFFISGLSEDDVIQNRVLESLYTRIMRAHEEKRLFDGGPVVTSQVYVHSKVMIVDDRRALIGSSNINDRSLLGSRDSEIAVLIEDKEFVVSSMNGKPWEAGKFALSLRLSLWAEHLGLHTEEVAEIKDPIAETTYKDFWLEIAESNTKIYQDVFSCIPNDTIKSRSTLRQSMSHWKQKLRHTTIDLGVAPDKIEFYQNGERIVMEPMTKLKSIKRSPCFLSIGVHEPRR